nr:MAG TPA: POLLEN ALLERGEN 5 ALLERGEN, SMALL HIGHLY DISULFIDE [Caudoviricetes sp.]
MDIPVIIKFNVNRGAYCCSPIFMSERIMK